MFFRKIAADYVFIPEVMFGLVMNNRNSRRRLCRKAQVEGPSSVIVGWRRVIFSGSVGDSRQVDRDIMLICPIIGVTMIFENAVTGL